MLRNTSKVPKIFKIGTNFMKKSSEKINSEILVTKNTIETKLRIFIDRLVDKYHLK